MFKFIETNHLKLIACNAAILKAAIDGNGALSKIIGSKVHPNWTEFGVMPIEYAYNKLLKNADENNWWTYLPIHKADNLLIGSGGYKGKPTIDGVVEIGYEITSTYRNKGLATELVQALVKHAFENQIVKTIIAHTLGNDNPSTKVLQKCRFIKTADITDPDDGLLWKWTLPKSI
ncbi:MAG: GNAT family N-acetyltransferase [Bacteroidia bacterium]|nr:GNAT family N-acetyltransferase [Bacteroidia bacterium]